MSFTAQVKDELSRVRGGCTECAYAQLSAIIRVCGTLSYRGPGRYAIRVSTETGAVARTMVKLAHALFDLETPLTFRQSNLHRTKNYLIEIPEQPGLEEALIRLGIIVSGRGLVSGVSPVLIQKSCCRQAFIRGVFMAGGFIADPRGDFHLEMAVSGEPFAADILTIVSAAGVKARVNRRRGTNAIYLKSYADVMRLLLYMGARRSAQAVAKVRQVKTLKNEVNRIVNAETANLNRTTDAAGEQTALIHEAQRLLNMNSLAPALREFCSLRLENPELSLLELGALCKPPVGKSAMYHRLSRLREMVEQNRS